MLRWAIILVIIGVVLEALGFTGAGSELRWVAHILLVIFLVFLVYSLITRRGGPTI